LTSAGNGWRCERGFASAGAASAGATCVALQVPPNAHIDFSGNRWECDTRYRRDGDVCVAENAR
jgi:hypothetical protein